MKRRSISALPDGFIVRQANSPYPDLATEAVIPLLLAFLEADVKTQGRNPEAPAREKPPRRRDASAYSLDPGHCPNAWGNRGGSAFSSSAART